MKEAAREVALKLQQQHKPTSEKNESAKVKAVPQSTEAEDDQEDPLEAYMKQLTKKFRPNTDNGVLKQISSGSSKTVEKVIVVKNQQQQPQSNKDTNGNKKFSIVTGMAKSAVFSTPKNKGNLMEEEMEMAEFGNRSEEEDTTALVDDDDFLSAESIAKVKTKSEMVFTDHSKVYYRPFRKDFYKEVPELAEMTAEEVNDYREELEDIKVRGKNCPKPIKSWAQCGISSKILEILKRNLFERPTPIQAQGIPIIMSGRDMIGIAKTGSGKTLAFLIPMFRHILDQPALEVDDGPIAIIMTPTRELATQITKECRKFTRHLNLNVIAVYGGTNISEQIAELKRGAEILVCTPGRMIDMLAANNGRVTNLRRVTYIVLDEADRMFDMGFEPQVTKILDNVRPDRQTVMFSATFPKKMEDLARKALHKPIEVAIGGRSVVCKDVEQHVVSYFSFLLKGDTGITDVYLARCLL